MVTARENGRDEGAMVCRGALLFCSNSFVVVNLQYLQAGSARLHIILEDDKGALQSCFQSVQ